MINMKYEAQPRKYWYYKLRCNCARVSTNTGFWINEKKDTVKGKEKKDYWNQREK